MRSPRPKTMPALATVLLLALTLPPAAAEVEVLGEANDATDALLGCSQTSYDKATGEIYVGALREPWRVVNGFWQDGCGGRGCDDAVSGRTVYGSFAVTEAGPSNRANHCWVRCDGFGYSVVAYGNVIPRGSTSASFFCTFYPGDPTFFRGVLRNAVRMSVYLDTPDPLPDAGVDVDEDDLSPR